MAELKPCKTGNYKHGYSVTHPKLFLVWETMRSRCKNPHRQKYNDYGGRGISVCKEWDEDCEAFCKWALENGYSQDLTIDRIDGNKGYCPSNCRWVTQKEQQNNKRSNHKIKYNGEIRNLSEWADMYGIGRTTLRERLKCGWSIEKALSTPVRQYSADMRPEKNDQRGENDSG